MKTYARIENDLVAEFVDLPDEMSIASIFPPPLVWVDVTDIDPRPQQNWTYIEGVFAPPPPPPDPFPGEKAAVLRNIRNIRETILNRLAGIGVIALYDSDTVIMDAIKTGRQALLELPQHPSILAASNRVELDAAILSVYRGIASAVPLSLKSAFDAVDL